MKNCRWIVGREGSEAGEHEIPGRPFSRQRKWGEFAILVIHGSLAKILCLSLVLVLTIPLLSAQAASAKGQGKDKNDTPTYNIYFGDLHTHTGYSDAYDTESTPWDAYAAAIAAGADFMAVTDHMQIWNAYSAYVLDEEEWADCLAAADYYTSDTFVAMAGYEAWLLANCGEINVYNSREFPPAETLGNRMERLPSFYDWIASVPGAIGQFNHPLYVSEDFMDYAFYNEARDLGMGVIEIHNEDFYEPSYIKALDAGWHVMPAANSDTHYSDWIAAHEVRTVLLAESLTPEDLYAAMSAGRGYGTLDRNLRVEFTLDGAAMGSNLSAADGAYTAWIKVEDPDGAELDEITLVEIVTDGGVVVASMPTSGSLVELTVELSSEDSRYFYVRVTTASPLNGDVPGVTAWTAPVWTGR